MNLTVCDGTVLQHVTRVRDGAISTSDDLVVQEMPVSLAFNGTSHAVMMCTPCDLEAFAVGFSLTEGLVDRAADILDVSVERHADSAVVDITITSEALTRVRQMRRTLAGRTGCGVCGIESIDLLDMQPHPVRDSSAARDVSAAAIGRAAREFPEWQNLMRSTGAAHAAGWCSLNGAVLAVMEDVGRHNALDKLIGKLVERDVDLTRGFVFMSSRASYELVRKAARLDIPMIATISAPTSLAIRIAQRAHMRLVSFCRKDGFVEYCAAPLLQKA
jgi:FdhD protein